MASNFFKPQQNLDARQAQRVEARIKLAAIENDTENLFRGNISHDAAEGLGRGSVKEEGEIQELLDRMAANEDIVQREAASVAKMQETMQAISGAAGQVDDAERTSNALAAAAEKTSTALLVDGINGNANVIALLASLGDNVSDELALAINQAASKTRSYAIPSTPRRARSQREPETPSMREKELKLKLKTEEGSRKAAVDRAAEFEKRLDAATASVSKLSERLKTRDDAMASLRSDLSAERIARGVAEEKLEEQTSLRANVAQLEAENADLARQRDSVIGEQETRRGVSIAESNDLQTRISQLEAKNKTLAAAKLSAEDDVDKLRQKLEEHQVTASNINDLEIREAELEDELQEKREQVTDLRSKLKGFRSEKRDLNDAVAQAAADYGKLNDELKRHTMDVKYNNIKVRANLETLCFLLVTKHDLPRGAMDEDVLEEGMRAVMRPFPIIMIKPVKDELCWPRYWVSSYDGALPSGDVNIYCEMIRFATFKRPAWDRLSVGQQLAQLDNIGKVMATNPEKYPSWVVGVLCEGLAELSETSQNLLVAMALLGLIEAVHLNFAPDTYEDQWRSAQETFKNLYDPWDMTLIKELRSEEGRKKASDVSLAHRSQRLGFRNDQSQHLFVPTAAHAAYILYDDTHGFQWVKQDSLSFVGLDLCIEAPAGCLRMRCPPDLVKLIRYDREVESDS